MVAVDDSGDGEEDPTGKRGNPDWDISGGFAQKPKEQSKPFVIYGKRNDCLNKWWFFNYRCSMMILMIIGKKLVSSTLFEVLMADFSFRGKKE